MCMCICLYTYRSIHKYRPHCTHGLYSFQCLTTSGTYAYTYTYTCATRTYILTNFTMSQTTHTHTHTHTHTGWIFTFCTYLGFICMLIAIFWSVDLCTKLRVLCMCMCMCMYMRACICMCVECVTWRYTCKLSYMYANVICMCMCMCMCMYVYVYADIFFFFAEKISSDQGPVVSVFSVCVLLLRLCRQYEVLLLNPLLGSDITDTNAR